MTTQNTIPVIFLAFANDQEDRVHYLRKLAEEARQTRTVLESTAVPNHLCELVMRQNASVDDIIGVFQDSRYRDRIAIFHFGGHANNYQLLLEDAQGKQAVADTGGLSAFLGLQQNLHLVFLNGCSTEPQVQGLLDANVPAVIATLGPIEDEAATDFAAHFYQALASGRDLGQAYDEAIGVLRTKVGSNPRHLYWVSSQQEGESLDRWPWICRVRPGAEIALTWNLPEAANKPLFALPPIPDELWQTLPESPFRGLDWFAREHAPIFFGRGYEIRDLYHQITASHTPPLILFYGQSGVGKSSLLAAGLLPRLERSQTICYQRRDQTKGLLGTLCTALAKNDIETSLGAAWQASERRDHRPLLIVLDQAEEAFTHPNADYPHEVTDFLAALSATFTDPSHRPQGKLILSFRKEWLAEIKRQVMEQKFPHTEVHLQQLSARGVIEAIEEPMRVPELQAKYRLTIEKALPHLVADDLLADRESAVAPTLQILLTKMWERAKDNCYDQPTFNLDLYDEIRKQGLGLQAVLDQQLTTLHKQQTASVDSGLALDLLAFHTTPQGYAAEHSQDELCQVYSHQQAALEPLVRGCKELYLLVDPKENQPKQAPSSRLAHDTLAPLVRLRFDQSDKPGQRARRILENRAVDWQADKSGLPLDEQDLKLVEQGVAGMRSMTSDESRLVKASQQRRKNNRHKRLVAWSLSIAAIFLFITFLLYQNITSEKRALESHSLALANAGAKAGVQGDYDLALLLAMEANHTISQGMPKIQGIVRSIANVAPGLAQNLIPVTPSEVERILKNLAYFTPGLTRRRLEGHIASVATVAFHPIDSNIAVSSAADGAVFLWDLQSGAKRSLEWYTAPVRSLAFGPDGRQLVVGYEDGLLFLGESEGEGRWPVKAHEGAVTAVAISPDGGQALSGGADGKIILWKLQPNGIDPVWTFSEHTGEVTSVAFSPTDSLVVSGSRDGNIFFINVSDGTRRGESLFKDNGGVISLAISPDGKRIFAGAAGAGYGGFRLCLWSVDSRKCLDYPPYGLNGHLNSITSVAFSPDGHYVISASADRSIILWNGLWNEDPNKRTVLQRFLGHEQPVTSVAFSPDGTQILSGSRDGTIRLWDIGAAGEVHRLHPRRFALSPDGHTVLLLTGEENKPDLYLWDVERESAPRSLILSANQIPAVRAMSFSPDESTALLGLMDGRICKLEVAATDIDCFRDQHPNWVLDIAFNPKNSSQAISGSYCGDPHGAHPGCRNTLILWDVRRGEKLYSFDAHTNAVTAVDFSPTGDSVVSASADQTIVLWDVQKREKQYTYSGHAEKISDVAFSPDGEKILSGSKDRTMRLWDVKNPAQDPRLYIGSSSIATVAFSHNGRLALSGADDALHLWNVQSGEELAQLRGHTGDLLQARFLRNDRMLISQDWLTDYTLRVWELPPEILYELVDWVRENRYIRGFTCKERENYRIEPLCSN